MNEYARGFEEVIENQELKIPDFVTLQEKYKCNKCRHCKYDETGLLRDTSKQFYNCEGNPTKRTQCKKRCWPFNVLWIFITTVIISIFFQKMFFHFKNILVSLAYTIIFMVIIDIICCIVEYAIDKICEKIEEIRKKKYDKTVENLKAINELKHLKRSECKENEDIVEAKKLYEELSGEFRNKIKFYSEDEKQFPELKREFYKKYKEFLKNMENLLEDVNSEMFDFSEIRILFQHRIPKLYEYLNMYIEDVENKEESEVQIKEFIQLFEAFSTEMLRVQEMLKRYDSESFMYKIRALREVVSNTNYAEEQNEK